MRQNFDLLSGFIAGFTTGYTAAVLTAAAGYLLLKFFGVV